MLEAWAFRTSIRDFLLSKHSKKATFSILQSQHVIQDTGNVSMKMLKGTTLPRITELDKTAQTLEPLLLGTPFLNGNA